MLGTVKNSFALFENNTHDSAGKSWVSCDLSICREPFGRALPVIALSLPMMLCAGRASKRGRRDFARVMISATYWVMGSSTFFRKFEDGSPLKSPSERHGISFKSVPAENR